MADFLSMLAPSTPLSVKEAMARGERATWPHLAMIRQRCAVELALDRLLYELKSSIVSSPLPAAVAASMPGLDSPKMRLGNREGLRSTHSTRSLNLDVSMRHGRSGSSDDSAIEDTYDSDDGSSGMRGLLPSRKASLGRRAGIAGPIPE